VATSETSEAKAWISWPLGGTAERGCGKTHCGYTSDHRGLKPALILGALRGAEAPLFHGGARIQGGARIREFSVTSERRALPKTIYEMTSSREDKD
jgi:hypothetical protein